MKEHDKAPPALTVWLAREGLKGDLRTIEERWRVLIAKLTVEKQGAIEKAAGILQEIAEKTPQIEAWFANNLRQDLTTGRTPSREMEHESVTA